MSLKRPHSLSFQPTFPTFPPSPLLRKKHPHQTKRLHPDFFHESNPKKTLLPVRFPKSHHVLFGAACSCQGPLKENWRAASPPGATTLTVATLTETVLDEQKKQKQKYNQFTQRRTAWSLKKKTIFKMHGGTDGSA
ncbi:hypothetical protein E3U43_004395 [Larimichthys crocea]|uniref:Uncharacterized protein n=1 Tax=Larimichthys crocea TaxID=215358 RepID=A0ACD3QD50_LARCR|nr:hypothetical protein E3U43_004395 [Larimichthys crocea]